MIVMMLLLSGSLADHVTGTCQWFNSSTCQGDAYHDAWSLFVTSGRGCFDPPLPGTCNDGTQTFCADKVFCVVVVSLHAWCHRVLIMFL
jgi:hypothetical protein